MNSFLIVMMFFTPVLLAGAFVGLIIWKKFMMDLQHICLFVGIGLILSYLIAFGGYRIGTSHSRFQEVWNQRGMTMKYEERWTTHETRTETYTTGSGKNSRTHTRTIHYTETHGPYWTLYTEDGNSRRIDASVYNHQKTIWKNESHIGTHRGSSAGFDRAITGQIYEIRWDNQLNTIYPVADLHTYVNKVRASSNSILKLAKPTKALLDRYPLPSSVGDVNPIINYSGVGFLNDKDYLFIRQVNASLGMRHQIHGMFVIVNANEGMGVVNDILSAWQGTNKNELVVFLGVEKGSKKISWVKCESWLDNTTIYGYIVDELLNNDISGELLGNALLKHVPRNWKRKHFHDFEYLQIDISKGGVIFCVIGWLVLYVVMVIVLYKNEENYGSYTRHYNGFRTYNRYR